MLLLNFGILRRTVNNSLVQVFLDKRDNTEFDLLTVSEPSTEPPQEEGASLNSPRNLALEATYVNHNFSQQVLKSDGERYKFDMDNPFIDADEEGEVASVAYRYRYVSDHFC